MNANDQIIVISAVVVTAAFVAFFGFRGPSSSAAWLLRRMLPGIALLIAITALATWWLHGIADESVAACQAQALQGLAYDCEDDYLVVVMALLAGIFSIILYVIGLSVMRVARRLIGQGAIA